MQLDTNGFPQTSEFAGMSESGFPQGDRDGSSHDLAALFEYAIENGVWITRNTSPDSLLCTKIANTMQIEVAPGACIINGRMRRLPEPVRLDIPQAPVNADYRIVMRLSLDAAYRRIWPMAITGELARNSVVWDIQLAGLTVPADSLSLNDATLVDTRADPELCGFAAFTGQPPYQPPADVPALLWDYSLFPDSLTPEQRTMVEDTPDWLDQFLSSRTAREFKVYDVPGTYTYTAPGTGDYIVEVVGGGGRMESDTFSPAGGGGGYAKKLVRLTKGQQVTVTVGAAAASLYSGGASSFGAYLTAAGGSYTSGGNGVGGDLNISGGQGGNDVMLGASFLCSSGAIPNGPGRGGYSSGIPATAGIVIISR